MLSRQYNDDLFLVGGSRSDTEIRYLVIAKTIGYSRHLPANMFITRCLRFKVAQSIDKFRIGIWKT